METVGRCRYTVHYLFLPSVIPFRYRIVQKAYAYIAMKLPAIDFRHLRYFTAVAEQKSFRAAGELLHISQPPLTRQVQQLEERLGVQLFLRGTRGVELTDAGQVFYQEARNLLALITQAVDRTRLTGQGQLGRLDVGVFGSASLDVIPRIVKQFRSEHPHVEVVLHNLDRLAQIRALREHRLTVGFNRFIEDEPELYWETILREPIYVALHAQQPLAQQAELGLTDLSDQPLILYPRTARNGFAQHVIRLFHERGLIPRVDNEVDDVVTAVALVSAGMGVALVMASASNLRLPGVVYRPLCRDLDATVDLSIMHRRDDDSPLLQAFMRVARQFPTVAEQSSNV